jgi:hypothetical protein
MEEEEVEEEKEEEREKKREWKKEREREEINIPIPGHVDYRTALLLTNRVSGKRIQYVR